MICVILGVPRVRCKSRNSHGKNTSTNWWLVRRGSTRGSFVVQLQKGNSLWSCYLVGIGWNEKLTSPHGITKILDMIYNIYIYMKNMYTAYT